MFREIWICYNYSVIWIKCELLYKELFLEIVALDFTVTDGFLSAMRYLHARIRDAFALLCSCAQIRVAGLKVTREVTIILYTLPIAPPSPPPPSPLHPFSFTSGRICSSLIIIFEAANAITGDFWTFHQERKKYLYAARVTYSSKCGYTAM